MLNVRKSDDATLRQQAPRAGPPIRGDEFDGTVPRLAPAELLTELSQVRPLISLAHIALEWTLIGGAIWLCQRYWHPLLYGVTVAWIGARQHALGILMHEAAHFRLLRGKRWNDAIAEPLVAWPLFVTTRAYRQNHFAHHRHVNTERDPDLLRKQNRDWAFPKSGPALAWLLLRDVLGLNTHEQLAIFSMLSDARKERQQPPRSPAPLGYRLAQLGFYLGAAALLTWQQLWWPFFLFWVVPLFTWLKMILRIRSIAEHFATRNDSVFNISRATHATLLERLFIAPKNIHLHLDHHLFPSVPFHRLPELHAFLMRDPTYRAKAHLTESYLGVLRECTQPVEQQPRIVVPQ
jgi:fatty acid desaturase